MKVRELIAKLQTFDQDRTVVLSSDGEGNGFSPLSLLCAGAYRQEGSVCGDFGLEVLTKEDEEDGYSEDDVITNGVPAVALWPVA